MNQWHNCPNLAAFWYNTISAVFYLYSLYSSGARYHSSRINSNEPRYGQNWNETYLLLHLAGILLSSSFWLLFVFSSVFKTGNLANDYVELNTIRPIISPPHITWSLILIFKKILSRMKYHLIPLNSTMHLCGAFFLLVPVPLELNEEIRHGIANSDGRSIHALLSIYTPEIVNFITAAVSITVRLPTVFLNTTPQMSILFSFMLFIANSYILIRCLLHQLLSTQNLKYDIIEMAVGDVVIFILTLSNYCLIYEMARTRYVDMSYEIRVNSSVHSSPKSAIGSTRRPTVLRFWPNLLSTAFLIISLILNIDQYRLSSWSMPILFFDLILGVLHYLYWLIILLLFTFKTDWNFKFPSLTRKGGLLGRVPSPQIHNLCLKQAEPIYTCFQQLESVRSVSSESSRTPNQDFSSASSSSGSHTSERVASYKHIPSISKQLEAPDLNYEDLPSYRNVNRQTKNLLQEITEENVDQMIYFKSPNISQRSSNIHSSDSGIGINYRDHPDYHATLRSPGCDTPMSRSMSMQRHVAREYDIHEELVNICSDV